MDNELERFKSGINIAEYAQSVGYEIVTRESSKSSITLKAGDDKIVVATDKRDGHGVYFSVHDDKDRGSIIDFAQKRSGGNLGQVRKELRGWMPGSKSPSPKINKVQRIEKPLPSRVDRTELAAKYQQFKPYQGTYLKDRGITKEAIEVFNIREDSKGNAVFPHSQSDSSVSGWEVKNQGFTGFSAGGERGLFVAKLDTEKTKNIVICESAIDAISYAILKHEPGNLYISHGGTLSAEQTKSISDIVASSPGAKVQLAHDRDAAGEKMANLVYEKCVPANRDALREAPEKGKDWNDELKLTRAQERVQERSKSQEYSR